MEPDLTIPISYRGEELEFPAWVARQTWGFALRVLINGHELLYEKDDAGEYRAIVPPGAITDTKDFPGHDLLEAVAQVLTQNA